MLKKLLLIFVIISLSFSIKGQKQFIRYDSKSAVYYSFRDSSFLKLEKKNRTGKLFILESDSLVSAHQDTVCYRNTIKDRYLIDAIIMNVDNFKFGTNIWKKSHIILFRDVILCVRGEITLEDADALTQTWRYNVFFDKNKVDRGKSIRLAFTGKK